MENHLGVDTLLVEKYKYKNYSQFHVILLIEVMVCFYGASEGLNVKYSHPQPWLDCKEPVLLLTDRDDSSVVAPSPARH